MSRRKRNRISKSTIFAIVLSVAVIAGTYLVLIIPTVLKSRLPGVAVISPQLANYTPSVSYTGAVGYSDLDEIVMDIPVVLSRVFVARGDRVDEGQVIAEIDREKTISVLSELYGNAGFETGELYVALKKAGDKVTATASGVVYDVARKGEVVIQGDSIAEIGKNENLSITAIVSERNISKVGAGQQVEISAEAVDGSFTGRVITVSALASKHHNGRTEETVVEVEIGIEGEAEKLKSGYTVSGKIFTGVEASFLTVPYSAICQDSKGEYVFMLTKGRAEKHYIRTGRELAGCTEVSGVKSGDIIIDEPDGLSDGMLVKLKEAEN